MSRYGPSRLPDGTAELLDDVVSEVSNYIQGGDHLVIVEGYRCSLAKEKDSLEHINCVFADSCLDKGRVLVIVIVVFNSQFVRFNTLLMPRLTMGFEGF